MQVVDAIAKTFQLNLTSVESAVAGQGRTVFVSTVDGDQIVIKWSSDGDWAKWLPNAIRNSEALIKRGYPSAQTLHFGEVEGVGYAWVQQRLAGVSCNDGLDMSLLNTVLDAIDLQADADIDIEVPNTGEWSWVPAVVFDDEAGYWKAARALGTHVSELCDQFDEWVRELAPPSVRSDWVHLDFNFSNILSEDGRLTGIIDLDHLGIGDRSVDVACLAFEYERLRFRSPQSSINSNVELLRERVLNISGESGWRQAVTYCAIARLGWTSPTGFRVPIDETLASAESILAKSKKLNRNG